MPQAGALAVIRHMFAIWPSVQPPRRAAQRLAWSSHYKHAFAARLLIKHPIGILGLLKLPAVGEQVVDRNFSIGDEACAVGLAVL